jgi:hypothetical protein
LDVKKEGFVVVAVVVYLCGHKLYTYLCGLARSILKAFWSQPVLFVFQQKCMRVTEKEKEK